MLLPELGVRQFFPPQSSDLETYLSSDLTAIYGLMGESRGLNSMRERVRISAEQSNKEAFLFL